MSSVTLSTGHESKQPEEHDVKRCLDYDPKSGLFFWKTDRPPRTKAGDQAGHIHKTGYVRIGLCGHSYVGHRLAWLIYYGEWPPDIVDHINGDKSDNRIANLRLANVQQNGRNRKPNYNSYSGHRGVNLDGSRWRATITVGGKTKHIGMFGTIDEAIAARREAEEQCFGSYNLRS